MAMVFLPQSHRSKRRESGANNDDQMHEVDDKVDEFFKKIFLAVQLKTSAKKVIMKTGRKEEK